MWGAETGRTVLEFEASDRELTHVLFSPDGRLIVTVDDWGPAKV